MRSLPRPLFRLVALTVILASPSLAGSPAHAAPAKPKSWTPLRISAWPHPDGAFPAIPRVRGLSLGLTVFHDDESYGLQIGPMPSVTRGGGLQCGAAPEAGRFVGLQVGLVSATSKNLRGLQISPLNNIDSRKTRLRGIQVGAVNGSGDVGGLQLGMANRGVSLRGLQVGVANRVDRIRSGGQIGPINVILGKRSGGFQAGAINVCREGISGIQIGLFNTAKSLKGVQIGLLNRVTGRRFLWGVSPLLNFGW